jgi:hypothetical protein
MAPLHWCVQEKECLAYRINTTEMTKYVDTRAKREAHPVNTYCYLISHESPH